MGHPSTPCLLKRPAELQPRTPCRKYLIGRTCHCIIRPGISANMSHERARTVELDVQTGKYRQRQANRHYRVSATRSIPILPGQAPESIRRQADSHTPESRGCFTSRPRITGRQRVCRRVDNRPRDCNHAGVIKAFRPHSGNCVGESPLKYFKYPVLNILEPGA